MQLIQLMLAEMTHEAAATRRLLARLPDDQLGWQPHPRSMTLGVLAAHLGEIAGWGVEVVTRGEVVLDPDNYQPPVAANAAAAVERFEANVTRLKEALALAQPEDMLAIWKLRVGDRVVLEMPRSGALRSMVLNHLIHHRGQLSVYLRLLNVPLPSIYGPSADESA